MKRRRHKIRDIFSARIEVIVNVRGEEETIRISEYTDLPDPDMADFVQLNRCFVEQASRRGYVSTLFALAKKIQNQKQLRVNRLEAELYKLYRDKYSEKKVTETFIKRRIWRHPKWIAANKDLIEAQYQHDLLKGLLASLDDRKDALVTLGANLRKEFDHHNGG